MGPPRTEQDDPDLSPGRQADVRVGDFFVSPAVRMMGNFVSSLTRSECVWTVWTVCTVGCCAGQDLCLTQRKYIRRHNTFSQPGPPGVSLE